MQEMRARTRVKSTVTMRAIVKMKPRSDLRASFPVKSNWSVRTTGGDKDPRLPKLKGVEMEDDTKKWMRACDEIYKLFMKQKLIDPRLKCICKDDSWIKYFNDYKFCPYCGRQLHQST